MSRILLVLIVVALVVACTATTAVAHWEEGDGHKMHYPQLPKETVLSDSTDMDVAFMLGRLADDWQCPESGYVQDIHFWVSWQDNEVQQIDVFTVAIWSDNPQGPDGYSIPGTLLWWRDFSAADFTVIDIVDHDQDWFNPWTGEYSVSDHNKWQQINIVTIEDPFYQEEGAVYWLEIDMWGAGPTCGWKVSGSDHFRDNAVYWDSPKFEELRNPTTGESLDLAFVITTERGHQKMHYPQLPHFLLERGMDVAFNLGRLADDWECSKSGCVEDIHFWVSWQNNEVQSISRFTAAIWSDNPRGPDGHSVPDSCLWWRDFDPNDFSVTDMEDNDQDWFDPWAGAFSVSDHNIWQQINIVGIEDPFYQAESTIYWLEIDMWDAATTCGWKVSGSDHFRDNAVYWDSPAFKELIDPISGESLDLAFVITEEEEGYKMHYPQYPKDWRYPRENGMDVRFWVWLADDWQCSESGCVTDIHFWVSWHNNEIQPIGGFSVTIWSDNPVGPDGYSVPDSVLWGHEFYTGDFTVIDMDDHSQDWFDPQTGAYLVSDHNKWQQVDILDIVDPFYQAESTVYWLEIDMWGAGTTCGWKISGSDQFRDDAVYWNGFKWVELRDPSTTESLDMAFVITTDGITGDGGDKPPTIINELKQNYPNPFNPTTEIVFSIGRAADVSLRIYDVSGRLVRSLVEERREAGLYREAWDGRNTGGKRVASGVYFCQLRAGIFTKTKKMVLLK